MNIVISINDLKENCTGCGACSLACPCKCITLSPDTEDFMFPTIDENKCIGCGKCIEKCHIKHDFESNKCFTPVGFCAWRQDNIRLCSSSGGIFSSIIDSLCDKNTYVFGAAFSNDWKSVVHIRCNSNHYSRLRESKYVISQITNSLYEAKSELQKGNKVIFSGTPCQIAALYAYLGCDYKNLITIDVLCHGVPSQKMYKKHLDFISKGREVVLVDFRPKGNGWNARFNVAFSNGDVYNKDQMHDWYLYNYFQNTFLRRSCYHCKYSTSNHIADITLGDFWYIEKYKKEYANEPGVGLVICNTQKGLDCFKHLEGIHVEEVDSDYYSYIYRSRENTYNRNKRDQFFAEKKHKNTELLEKFFKAKVFAIDILVKAKRIVKKAGRKD